MPRKTTTIPDPGISEPDSDTPKTLQEKRTEAVGGLFQLAQYGCIAFGQFADAGALGMHGPNMAKEIVALADENSKVASKVDLLIEIGPYAGIVAAGLPFILQILVNHGILQAERCANAGVVTPQTLDSQMKTQMMRQAMEAMQEQQRIEEEMRAMEEEMQARMQANGHNDSDESSGNQYGEYGDQ
jgi:hypothetical protein